MMDAADESWSAYWRLGELTTLNFFREGYTGELAVFWEQLAETLPEGGCALDLATGNGAVALIVHRRARSLGKLVHVEGVDAADIDPAAFVGASHELRSDLRAIRFHTRTPFEQTGLANGKFHLITSQYGIEYGDLRTVAAEIARLLAPGGRFGAIMHSQESTVNATAGEVVALLELVLDQLDIPALVKSIVAGCGEIRDRPALLQAVREEGIHVHWATLESAIVQARGAAAHSQQTWGTLEGFLQRVLAPFNGDLASDTESKLAQVEQVLRTSRNLKERMEALRRSALSPDDLNRFLGMLREVGLTLESPRSIHFGAQREPMGYGLIASRIQR